MPSGLYVTFYPLHLTVWCCVFLATRISLDLPMNSLDPHPRRSIFVTPRFSPGILAIAILLAASLAPVAHASAESPRTTPAARVYKSAFPRLASHEIGDKHYDDPEYQALIARNDFTLLGFYKGWGKGPESMRAAVRAMKAINPSLIVANYTILESYYWDRHRSDAPAIVDVIDKLESGVGPVDHGGTWKPNDWWGRNHLGKQVNSPNYPTTARTNLTRFVTPDANGDRYAQWFAKWCDANFFAPVPEIDVWYSDNAFYRPRSVVDWDRDGIDDSPDDPRVRVYYREGMADFWAAINRLHPTMPVIANVDGNFDLTGRSDGFLTDPQYRGKLQGALFESVMGRNFSAERQWGWDRMMEAYRSLVDNTLAPHLVVFDVKSTADGRLLQPENERNGYGGGAAYALGRYAFASALMEDGYFAVKSGGYSKATTVWFDEFDLAGTADTSWLGQAIDPPQRKPFQDGVYLRRFEHGAAIVNPRSNPGTRDNNRPSVDVAIPVKLGRYQRIQGRQDPKTNSGEALPLNAQGVPHLVLAPGDGLILRRQ